MPAARTEPARRTRRRPLLLAAGLLGAQALAGPQLAPPPAQQVELSLRQRLADLRLAGQATLRVLGLRVYDARLFVTPKGLDPRRIDQAFALDLRYARAFSGQDIARRSREEMRRLDRGSEAERARWQARLAELLPDVAEGEHLSAVHRPGAGTLFLHNGRPLGEVEDPAFAPAFFAIWLHPDSRAPALREALLADAGTP